MKILCVVDGRFPWTGGSQKQAILIAERMREKGHAVEYLCPDLEVNSSETTLINGIQCRRLGFLRVPGLASASYCLNVAWFLLLHGRSYDVIHIHMVEKFAAVLGVLKPVVKARVLAKVAGATEFDGGVFDTRKSTWINRLVRKLALGIGVFQTISRDTQQRLKALGVRDEDMLVLPNAIDVHDFTPSQALHGGEQSDTTVIAFSGRLVEVKCLPNLIDALAQLKANCAPRVELWLAGDGPMRSTLEAQVKRLDLSTEVKFFGEIADVPAFLNGAHAYCQVSRMEGLSNSVLEAMASGLPCVLTRISGNEDLLVEGETGFGVDVDDPIGLASQLQKLVDDRQRCRHMGATARQFVESAFSVEHVTAQIERCYRGEGVSIVGQGI